MLSILIPTYNYNITPLVSDLHKQCSALQVDFEICVLDDASTQYIKENKSIEQFSYTIHTVLEKNIGRTAARQQLANQANYDWLLFLDADVSIIHNNFIATYIQYIKNKKIDSIYGGISYAEKSPSAATTLRWYYGKKREALPAEKRRKFPYNIISQNLLIKKEVFLNVNVHLENVYGLDIVFSNELKKQNASILHIDNTIRHDGLENNEDFLRKSLKAVETTVIFEKKGILTDNCRSLQRMYSILRKTGVLKPIVFLTRLFLNPIEKKIIGNTPSIFLFDLYRLNYYVRLK